MMVTGVQPVGSKGLTAVQVAASDPKDTARARVGGEPERNGDTQLNRPGEPQPVVFPRSGLGLDQRPVELRQQRAAERYQSDGGEDRGDQDAPRERDEHAA
jgi:hypothetical protein